MNETRPLRIVLAEDSALLRAGLEGILDRFGFEVTAAVEDAEALLAAVGESRPDLVITDVRMPPGFTDEGLRAALALRREQPGLAVIVLSQFVQQTYATELLQDARGAVGYLLKDRITEVEDFAESIRLVAAGGTVIDPEVVRQLIVVRPDPLSALTPREVEVLALMAEGRSNAVIAQTLVVSDAAVAKHIGNLLMKLNLPPDSDGHRRVLAVLAYLRA